MVGKTHPKHINRNIIASMEAMFERELKPRTSLLSVSGTSGSRETPPKCPNPSSSGRGKLARISAPPEKIRSGFGQLWRNRNYPTEVIQINDYIYICIYLYICINMYIYTYIYSHLGKLTPPFLQDPPTKKDELWWTGDFLRCIPAFVLLDQH